MMNSANWHTYIKKPIEVIAMEINEKNIVIKTSHGIMKSKIGDYLIINNDGSKHVCDRNIFLETYDHIKNDIYKKKPIKIRARRLTENKDIETLEGIMHAKKDDYLIEGAHKELYPVSPEVFEYTYMLSE